MLHDWERKESGGSAPVDLPRPIDGQIVQHGYYRCTADHIKRESALSSYTPHEIRLALVLTTKYAVIFAYLEQKSFIHVALVHLCHATALAALRALEAESKC
jgi:hypothetical protein